jgi:hypothetical protein
MVRWFKRVPGAASLGKQARYFHFTRISLRLDATTASSEKQEATQSSPKRRWQFDLPFMVLS